MSAPYNVLFLCTGNVAEGELQPQAFRNAYHALQRRIGLFLSLAFESIDELSLQTRLREIGRSGGQDAA